MSATRNKENITTLVIHCSATPNGQYYSAEDIDQWHKERGFSRALGCATAQYPLHYIGYHFVIILDGTAQVGRQTLETGAHVKGHNAESIGICLIGTNQFTEQQWSSLRRLILALTHQFPSITKVVGHRDLSPDTDGDGVVSMHEWLKTCPGFEVKDFISNGIHPLPEHFFVEPKKNTSADELSIKPSTLNIEAEGINILGQVGQIGMDMKPWWQSKTILAVIAGMLPALARLAGFDPSVLAPYSADIMAVIAAALAIYGRATAKTAIR